MQAVPTAAANRIARPCRLGTSIGTRILLPSSGTDRCSKDIYHSNIYDMKRTTVFLDDALLRRMQAHARKHGMSFASAVREAVRHYLASSSPRRSGRLPSVTGQFSSGRRDVSSRAEDLLWKEPHD